MRHTPSSVFNDAVPFPHAPIAVPAARAAAVLRGILWVLRAPGRMMAIRRDMALLGSMSGIELADIGLSRQDVQDAGSLPIGSAPWFLLTSRAAERRQAALSRRR